MSNIKPLTARQEVRREKILSAARKLVASQGYDGMVMSDLAESAEVSPTTLYNLFNTKDELLLEALDTLYTKNKKFSKLVDRLFIAKLQGAMCCGQLKPDSKLSFSSATAGAVISL